MTSNGIAGGPLPFAACSEAMKCSVESMAKAGIGEALIGNIYLDEEPKGKSAGERSARVASFGAGVWMIFLQRRQEKRLTRVSLRTVNQKSPLRPAAMPGPVQIDNHNSK